MDYDCPICSLLPSKPVETICCGQVLCLQCADLLKSCPLCRDEPFKFQQSKALQRIISRNPSSITQINQRPSFVEPQNNESLLPSRIFSCREANCYFAGNAMQTFQHIAQMHPLKVISFLDAQQQEDTIRFSSKLNSKKHTAKFGLVQKHYCGQKFEVKCGCCNGFCGPTNGCNCASCSELDLEFYRLPKKGFLINKEGRVAKYHQGRYSCGTMNCSLLSECNPCKALQHARYSCFAPTK